MIKRNLTAVLILRQITKHSDIIEGEHQLYIIKKFSTVSTYTDAWLIIVVTENFTP